MFRGRILSVYVGVRCVLISGEKWQDVLYTSFDFLHSSGSGFIMCSSKETHDSDADLDVDGDDTLEYGKAQYPFFFLVLLKRGGWHPPPVSSMSCVWSSICKQFSPQPVFKQRPYLLRHLLPCCAFAKTHSASCVIACASVTRSPSAILEATATTETLFFFKQAIGGGWAVFQDNPVHITGHKNSAVARCYFSVSSSSKKNGEILQPDRHKNTQSVGCKACLRKPSTRAALTDIKSRRAPSLL